MQPDEFQKTFDVSRETFSKLRIYHDQLAKWQKAINLVSPKTISESWQRHFADSAQLAEMIPQNSKVADLGSGAGFPGLVLAIMRPDLKINLVESDGRKCEFLKNVSRETSTEITIHNARVELILEKIEPEIITARAFARLKDILDYASPAAQKNPDLTLILLKGQGADEEIKDAKKFYQFEVSQTQSRTEKNAAILKITQLKK